MHNSFQLITTTEAFVKEFRTSLKNCQKSLYAQFMTYEADSSGLAFTEHLVDKASEGVEVRLMIDYYSDVVISDVYPRLFYRPPAVRQEHARTQALFECLPQLGVAVKRTAPPGVFGQYMFYRNHKKMVLIDRQIAFVGGINISDHNYAWKDFMVRIEGPLVNDLMRDYCSTWDGSTISLERSNGAGDYVLNQCAGRYSIHEEIIRMIEQARHSVVIESPYLLGDDIESSLLEAAEHGVQVTLVTPFRSNKTIYRVWLRTLRHRLSHRNILIYGCQANGGMSHAKLIMVDDRCVSFGSCNMFELEGLAQKELNVFTRNSDLIDQFRALVANDIAHSELLTPPKRAYGRFTYTLPYRLLKWWTRQLLRRPKWKKTYC